MLTRLRIHNFKCFVGFEYQPEQRQLILGGNGSGKSSLMDALFLIRQFLVVGEKGEVLFASSDRTKWLAQPHQSFELEATLAGSRYIYRLELDAQEDLGKPKVTWEKLYFDSRPIFEFEAGHVRLYNDQFEQTATYPFDSIRSALATIARTDDNEKLTRFRRWTENILCFRINPFNMTLRAEAEDSAPKLNLSNFAAWYRHLAQQYPRETQALFKSLQSAIEGFEYLRLETLGQNVRLLVAEFTKDGAPVNVGFNQLSDGQRNLISLYTILHFVIAKGGTVILDEPDNFISLREIQPWLMAVDEAIEHYGGQAILISHHPELINQWAPNYGVRFVRHGMGPVRVEKFHGDPDSLLPPAELIARGWDSE
jgi:ATPase subunit of ABC transporter with duplicated ATPase domains